MASWARYPDGVEVDEEVFRVLAKYAPSGTLDVFASDQHSSYLRLINSYLKHVGEGREATDDDVREVCKRFARGLAGTATAALFNHLAFTAPGFREALGESTMLIGRLEDTNPDKIDGGRGLLAKLSVQPEDIAEQVEGFKTLVKLDPDNEESWKRNLEWLHDVFERCCALRKPLFNETLALQRPGESKPDMARRLPEAVVKIAEEFGPYGHFYKTQVPMLWAEDDGRAVRISSPDEIRGAARKMAEVVDRPMLLLSAAVDFEQYSAQYAFVSDLVAGPMCGRAYFKEAFTAPETKDLDTLESSFSRIALPRMRQIVGLATLVSKPWWHNFEWMAHEAGALLSPEQKPVAPGVKADFGY